ncbi:MAG: serine/threonine protein kinase [Candidatus Obscuribacterales bacterium]|nr:serine/threonine protein kinase [Candidatus Obscuribacterales bacterium]
MIGTVLDDKYWIVSELGAGGAGTVYKAEQRELKRFVAIKVLHAKKTADLQLIKEAKNLQKVRSPHVVNVIAVGLVNKEQPYLVMEYLDGESLDTVIKREGSLSESQTSDIAIQICLALEAAHKESIVHRDLKPANILLSKGTGKPIAKVLDFGLAKNLNPTESLAATGTKTGTGNLVGTVAYMSPEVCSGQKADLLSDIYSFGCILYECISGHPPFQADNWVALLHMHREVAPQSLREDHPELSPEMDTLILKCLQKDPLDRFSSPSELRSALEMIQTGRIHDLASSGLLRLRRSKQSEKLAQKLLPVGIALAVVGLCVAVIMLKTSQATKTFVPVPKTHKIKFSQPEAGSVKLSSLSVRVRNLPRITEAALTENSKIPAAVTETDEIIARSKDPKVLAVAYQLKGMLLSKGNPKEALSCFKLAYANMTKAFGGKDSIESTHALIGQLTMYYSLGDDGGVNKTIKKLLPLIHIVETSELPSAPLAIAETWHASLYVWSESPFETYHSYSEYLARKNDLANSSKFALKAIAACTYLRPEPYLQLATNALNEGKPAEAQKWVDKVTHFTDLLGKEVEETRKNLAGNRESEHNVRAAYNYKAIARWYDGQQRYKEAIFYFRRCASMAEGSNYYSNMGFVSESRTRIEQLERHLKEKAAK